MVFLWFWLQPGRSHIPFRLALSVLHGGKIQAFAAVTSIFDLQTSQDVLLMLEGNHWEPHLFYGWTGNHVVFRGMYIIFFGWTQQIFEGTTCVLKKSCFFFGVSPLDTLPGRGFNDLWQCAGWAVFGRLEVMNESKQRKAETFIMSHVNLWKKPGWLEEGGPPNEQPINLNLSKYCPLLIGLTFFLSGAVAVCYVANRGSFLSPSRAK